MPKLTNHEVFHPDKTVFFSWKTYEGQNQSHCYSFHPINLKDEKTDPYASGANGPNA